MAHLKLNIVLLLALTCIFIQVLARPSKIPASLQRNLNSGNKIDILISFNCAGETQQILNQFSQTNFLTRTNRIEVITSALKTQSRESQKTILEFLSSNLEQQLQQKKKIRSIWITNQIAIKEADIQLVNFLLTKFPEICIIHEDERFPLEQQQLSVSITDKQQKKGGGGSISAEWNVEQVRAQEVWESEGGNSGDGVVIGTIDTGVRGTHEILASSFLGDYGWYDPHEATQLPNDGNGQGTHRMGVIVGNNGFGVAPNAKWSSCKGCDDFSCPLSYLLACGEFMACPTLWNMSNPDCSKAPHIVSGGFISAPANTFYNEVISVWRAVGIIPFFSVGNSGSACSTIRSPADSTEGVFGVGSTVQDGLAVFSSRGPSTTGLIKPDILAPGGVVNSSSHLSDNGYTSVQGSSANAIASGVSALLKSENLGLNYDQVKIFLCDGANRNLDQGGQECGGVPDNVFPNNVIGCGLVDAFASFLLVQNSTVPLEL